MTSLPGAGRPEYVTIGTISAPHGVRGAVRVYPHTDRPERFRELREVYLGAKGQPQGAPRAVQVLEANPRLVLLQIDGVYDRNGAEVLRGLDLLVPLAQVWPLPEGHYYHFDLVGLAVYDRDGVYHGKLSRVYSGPANDFYAVAKPGAKSESLLPATKQVVVEVDLTRGRMTVQWCDWSFADEADDRGTSR